jgi:hypothetical protein
MQPQILITGASGGSQGATGNRLLHLTSGVVWVRRAAMKWVN